MSRPVAPVPYEPEEEIDLGRYASALAARWWLALAGLVAGAVLGYLLALGGTDVFRAQALVDVGSPQAPGGGQVQNPTLLVTRAREIARADATVRQVARETGMPFARLRGGISVKPVTGGAGKPTATTLVQIAVKGQPRRDVALAANAIARVVVGRVSPYVENKIANLRSQITADERRLAALDDRIQRVLTFADNRSGSATDRLIAITSVGALEQRRDSLQDDLREQQQLLALAQNVEQPRLLERGSASKTTARSRRNSAVVGAVIGLLLGLVVALAWDPVAAALARRSGP